MIEKANNWNRERKRSAVNKLRKQADDATKSVIKWPSLENTQQKEAREIMNALNKLWKWWSIEETQEILWSTKKSIQ